MLGGAGHAAAMISSLKNNKRPKKKGFKIWKSKFLIKQKGNFFRHKKVSEKELEELRKISKQRRKTYIKKEIVAFIIALIIVVIIFSYLYSYMF